MTTASTARASALVLSLALVSCGGGGGGGGTITTGPTPTPSANPSPGPGLIASANTLSFGSPSDQAQTFTVQESNYSGSFHETDNCAVPAIAQVNGVTTAGTVGQFTVVPRAIGTCVVSVTSDLSQKVTVSVVVSATVIPVY